MKQRIILSFGIVCLIAGLALGYQPVLDLWDQHHMGANAQAPVYFPTSDKVSQPEVISGQPTHIDIPALGISLAVIDGYFNSKNQSWTLSNDKAHHATVTPIPNNQKGNTFIYGHNRPEVFQHLPRIKSGDTAIVTTSNNHKFTYKLSSIKTTKPEDTSLFTYDGQPVLTLQTCTGLWYQNRTLFIFQLVEVS